MAFSKKGVKGKWQASVMKKPSYKKKAAHIKGGIKRREELKFVDLASAVYQPVLGTGVVQLLNGIATGDDYNSRDGRQATMRSVHIRGDVRQNIAGSPHQLARMLLVWDNAANGAALTVAQVMTADSSVAFPLVDNQNRFTILRDWQCALGGSSTAAGMSVLASPAIEEIDVYVKLDDLTQFNGTGATIASIQSGSLYLLFLTTSSSASTCIFTVATRVRFSEP